VTRNLNLIILIICGALVVLLGYEHIALQQRQRPSVFSSYDTGPNGYRALFEVLHAAGVPVTRFGRVGAALDPSVRTLVITGYEHDPDAKPLDRRDTDELRRFVTGGGRLVALDEEFAGPQDVTPGIGMSRKTPHGVVAIPLATNAYTAGVDAVRGAINWTFPFDTSRGIPLLANKDGIVALWYRYGRGEVIAVTVPSLFGNEALRNGDNARFAYNIIAGHGLVAFDEYIHGYSDGSTMWGVLPGAVHAAVWIVIAIAVIALIGANVPFAPPYLPAPADERTSSDYITAIAGLLRRSRRRPPDDDVVWNAAIDFQRRKEHA
jgi:hypothetical protein